MESNPLISVLTMEDGDISVSSISLGDTTAADVTMVPMGDGNVTQGD